MFCPKCGRKYDDHAKFCPGCGAPNRATAPPPRAPAPGPADSQSSSRPTAHDEGSQVPAPSHSPPAPPVIKEEEESVLPPPPSGIILEFRANKQGVERVRTRASSPSTASANSATSAQADAPSSTQNLATPAFDLSSEDCALPAQPPVWGFRTQATAFADKLAGNIPPPGENTSPQVMDCLRRIVRGALMHKDVYRDVASRGALTVETVWVAFALIVLANIGLRVGSLLGYNASFVIKTMLIQAAGWVGAVFAVQFFAKSQHKVDLPPLAWFRAMVFAQSVLVLSIVPALGIYVSAWAAVCTVAALMDVSGEEFKKAVVLFIVAGVTSAIIDSVLRSVLL